jgi:large subunit ribosomal protein L21
VFLLGGTLKIYAIVESGGKQYKVSPGQQIEVDLLKAEEGSSIDLDKVLLLAEDDKVTVGKPTVEGASVKATVKGNGRTAKVAVFKYKAKTRQRKLTGHRQGFTMLTIDEILAPGAEKKAAPAKKTATKAAATKTAAKKTTTKTAAKKTTAAKAATTRKPRAKKEVKEDGS